MIKKVEGISVFKQKEYIRAEHEAHEILVKNGYLPQGMTKDFKKVIVFKIQNEHRNNEKKEVFYFNNWQEAMESLCS
ncbi:hypothetical protein [Clostridium guangxiense]|uniref:hypothetical protein n=1 Tax=Clostridium guangxiense TaxID=1662055 RepID=UPI001E35DF0B|nr:hypothetical protein [Clostridium guangxiense]MCD2348121.1 hypothetical protein [Clostridium guangxiense]